MNAALGFNTYPIMRHGARASSAQTAAVTGNRLECYYSNGIVASADVRPFLPFFFINICTLLLVCGMYSTVWSEVSSVHAPAHPTQIGPDFPDPNTSGGILDLSFVVFRLGLALCLSVGVAYDRCMAFGETAFPSHYSLFCHLDWISSTDIPLRNIF
jgi:ubiquitin-like modifier-activating enzyme ATG7